MTQEEKQLLLQDLCARLPYGVKIELMPVTRGRCATLTLRILQDYLISDDVNYLPYLRPMSSMTEEEKIDYQAFFNYDGVEYPDEYIDWLNKNMFDYRGLIEKSLAIAVII